MSVVFVHLLFRYSSKRDIHTFINEIPFALAPVASASSEATAVRPLAPLVEVTGWKFNKKKFGLSFGLKNGLRFHFDSVTCLNYPLMNYFLVYRVLESLKG